MAVPSSIEIAEVSFKQNSNILNKSIEGLTDDEWVRRPNGSANNMLWVVGHCTWARSNLLKRLGDEWTTPWMKAFERGAKADETAVLPTPEEAKEAWHESSKRLKAAMELVSDETLSAASTNGPPTHDGKVSGVVNFLAYHETYHIGQAAYLRCWLGHSGVMG
jgi:uncharacterized damage-inducible protein DinB